MLRITSKTVRNAKSARISIPPCLKKVPKTETAPSFYKWKNDMLRTEPFWIDWFKGLTETFLTFSRPKILLIADKLRLDKELTIAHMSGKFKLVCFTGNVGHCMMEDNPSETAGACHLLLDRFNVPMDLEDLEKQEKLGIGFFSNAVKPYFKSV